MSKVPSLTKLDSRLEWLGSEDIRPFVLLRGDSRVSHPGKYFDLHWFPQEPLLVDPLKMGDIHFSNALLHMEAKAFEASGMAMPRWVFFDCAVMPGLISGFAQRTSTLPRSIKNYLGQEILQSEWTPLSLFIVIPTMNKNEWVAHNLTSMNALIPKSDRHYGLGFLSKAFGLAYANVQICCGMTQWGSPALKLHSHYGVIEVLTAYTPAHTYANTITYRLKVDPSEWVRFFTGEISPIFEETYEPAGFMLDPHSEESQIAFQNKIEQGMGPFFLNATEIRQKDMDQEFTVYRKRGK